MAGSDPPYRVHAGSRSRSFLEPACIGRQLANTVRLLSRRNRYYDPQTGPFTQEDPLGLAGGVNAYGFGAGDPVNFSDPFGLWSFGVKLKLYLKAGIGYLVGSKGAEVSVNASANYYSGSRMSGPGVAGSAAIKAGATEESRSPHAEAAAGVAAGVTVSNLDRPDQQGRLTNERSASIPFIGNVTLSTGTAADGSTLWQISVSRDMASVGVRVGPGGVQKDLPGGESKRVPAPAEPNKLPPGSP